MVERAREWASESSGSNTTTPWPPKEAWLFGMDAAKACVGDTRRDLVKLPFKDTQAIAARTYLANPPLYSPSSTLSAAKSR